MRNPNACDVARQSSPVRKRLNRPTASATRPPTSHGQRSPSGAGQSGSVKVGSRAESGALPCAISLNLEIPCGSLNSSSRSTPTLPTAAMIRLTARSAHVIAVAAGARSRDNPAATNGAHRRYDGHQKSCRCAGTAPPHVRDRPVLAA